jgi:hypothetical protein
MHLPVLALGERQSRRAVTRLKISRSLKLNAARRKHHLLLLRAQIRKIFLLNRAKKKKETSRQ